MNIIRIKDDYRDDMVVTIPLKQHRNNPYDDEEEKELTDNLIGVIAGNNYSISQLIDLSYKDSQQEGMPILMFETEEELRDTCQELEIEVWKHDTCAYCGNVVYGSFTLGDKGIKCYHCYDKEHELQKKKDQK